MSEVILDYILSCKTDPRHALFRVSVRQHCGYGTAASTLATTAPAAGLAASTLAAAGAARAAAVTRSGGAAVVQEASTGYAALVGLVTGLLIAGPFARGVGRLVARRHAAALHSVRSTREHAACERGASRKGRRRWVDPEVLMGGTVG